MAKYNFGGGLSGEANKVNFRKAKKFEHGKLFTFKELDRMYVNFLSCVKSVTLKGKKVSKADLTFKLVNKLYICFDKKTKFWSASDCKTK